MDNKKKDPGSVTGKSNLGDERELERNKGKRNEGVTGSTTGSGPSGTAKSTTPTGESTRADKLQDRGRDRTNEEELDNERGARNLSNSADDELDLEGEEGRTEELEEDKKEEEEE